MKRIKRLMTILIAFIIIIMFNNNISNAEKTIGSGVNEVTKLVNELKGKEDEEGIKQWLGNYNSDKYNIELSLSDVEASKYLYCREHSQSLESGTKVKYYIDSVIKIKGYEATKYEWLISNYGIYTSYTEENAILAEILSGDVTISDSSYGYGKLAN